MKINLVGNIFGTSGYAIHTRNLFKALKPLCEKIRIETQKPQGWQSLVSDIELMAIQEQHTPDMVTICVNTPNNWPFYYTDPCAAFFGYVVWEGTKIPQFWHQYMSDPRVTGILTPSSATALSITGVLKQVRPPSRFGRTPIYIVPHGANNTVFTPVERKHNTPFTFICHKGWNLTQHDRGGIPKVVQAFCQAFGEKDNVELILKINPAYAQITEDSLRKAFNELALPEKRKQILINFNTVSEKELSDIYKDAHAIVSGSYGESFNIPILEGMMCGCVPIVPKYGGHTDFTRQAVESIHVSGTHCKPFEFMYEDGMWYDVSITSLANAMKTAYYNRESYDPYNIANSVKQYTWSNTAKIITGIIEKHT